ncbi:amidohydrolase family protein [Streptomyces goshikiensis]|uniref:amidohydrolase family protein n=1 Tax=Streptomyces goshikiensis TaxID=1942 RepID=UPI0033C5F617
MVATRAVPSSRTTGLSKRVATARCLLRRLIPHSTVQFGLSKCRRSATGHSPHDVLSWATRGGAAALGHSHDLGTIEVGKKADLALLKNDDSPVSFPLLNPHGHVVLQEQRSDVHTVLVNGHVAKYRHRLRGIDLRALRDRVGNTVEHLRGRLGEGEWHKGMNPEVPRAKTIEQSRFGTEQPPAGQ